MLVNFNKHTEMLGGAGSLQTLNTPFSTGDGAAVLSMKTQGCPSPTTTPQPHEPHNLAHVASEAQLCGGGTHMLHPQEVSTAGWSAHNFGVSAFVLQSIVLVQVTVHSSKMGWGGSLRHHTCAWGAAVSQWSLYSWE